MERQKKRRGLVVWLLCLTLVTAASGCSLGKDYQETTVYAMDTILTFQYYDTADSKVGDLFREEVDHVNLLLSATDPGSELYRLNASDGTVFEASEELSDVISRCLTVAEETDGALNVALYPVIQAWGFSTGDYHVPNGEILKDLMKKIDWKEIRLNQNQVEIATGMALDMGAVGKGYLTDRCVEILKKENISSALLKLGGNIYAHGKKQDGNPWKVGIQKPFSEELAGYLTAEDEAVVTSGTYQRYFEKDGKRYHHIIDSETGYPVDNGLESVTIVSKSGFQADALSTAYFVMGLESSIEAWKQNPETGVVWILEDGTLYYTENLKGRFTAADGVESHIVQS